MYHRLRGLAASNNNQGKRARLMQRTCLLLALSGYRLSHRTCPLSRAERTWQASTPPSANPGRTLDCTINCACRCWCLRVYYAPHNAGCVGMTKAVLMALLLSVGLSAPAAAAKQYPRYGDPRPGGVWNDGPFACLPGKSCNCHPDTYVAIRCEGTPDGPQCWWNSNCYCEPPKGSQYCGSRSGDWPAFRKRPKASMRLY